MNKKSLTIVSIVFAAAIVMIGSASLFYFVDVEKKSNQFRRPGLVLIEDYKDVCINTDKKLAYEGTTTTVPYFVRVAWNPHDLKTSQIVNFEIQIFDANAKPLQDVTYDFVWKTGPDSGVIQDRYVADFGKIQSDILPIKTADPCYISVIVHIDSVGQKSFKRTDPAEIEKYGNMSPVAVQFHHYVLNTDETK